MTYLISLAIIIAVIVLCNSFYKDMKNPIWNSFVSKFGDIPSNETEKSFTVQMVFFKFEMDEEFDYLNSMQVAKTEYGVEIKPTINNFIMRPVFFPWSELEKVEEKRLFVLNRTVYKIYNQNTYIAI